MKLQKAKIYWRKFNASVLLSLKHGERYLWKKGNDIRIVTYYQWDKSYRGYFGDDNILVDPEYIAGL